MDTAYLVTLFLLGFFGGTLSGLLGIGGGIVMFPLLLYFPSLLGFTALSIKAAAAITSMQSFFGAVSGAIAHHRYRRVNMQLAYYFGGSMCITSLAGSILSKFIAEQVILLVFSLMAIVAAYMMLRPIKKSSEEDIEDEVNELIFNHLSAIFWGAGLGLLSGIIGQGGAFIFIPVMLYVLKVPTRITIGTALIIGIASSSAVLLGRISTLQIPYVFALTTVIGAVIGAQIGAKISQHVPKHRLRQILTVIIVITAVKMIVDALG